MDKWVFFLWWFQIGIFIPIPAGRWSNVNTNIFKKELYIWIPTWGSWCYQSLFLKEEKLHGNRVILGLRALGITTKTLHLPRACILGGWVYQYENLYLHLFFFLINGFLFLTYHHDSLFSWFIMHHFIYRNHKFLPSCHLPSLSFLFLFLFLFSCSFSDLPSSSSCYHCRPPLHPL